MEQMAQVLTIAGPVFILLVLFEWAIAYFKGVKIAHSFDTISSLSSGVTNIIKDVLGIAIIIVSYSFMYEHLAIFELKAYWWVFIIAFILDDFAGYWAHRFEHVINIFWNRHIIHHSSEEFNLACALRQDISAIVGIFFFLYIPMAIVGVPVEVIAVVKPIQLFMQFWYHTRLIDKMGFLEHIIVTPSHHRVHHAINEEYIDKNFSQIFIVWDKWFGTFQEELKSIPPVYGIKKQANTWNPILINYQHFWRLAKDAWRTKSWYNKFRIWFMPTGWRPEDMKQKYPQKSVQNVYTMKKYETEGSLLFKGWCWVQFFISSALTLYMFSQIANFWFAYVLLGGLFIMVSIFAYTTLMDGHRMALIAEIIKVGLGIFLLITMGSWFNLNEVFSLATVFFIAYIILSLCVTIYYCYIKPLSTKMVLKKASVN